MAYTDNEKSTGLEVLTSLATGDLFIVGDVSDSGRAKAITRANTITDFESVIDLANLQGQIDLTTQVTGLLPAANIDIADLTSNATFQTAVNNFVSSGGGGSSGGKPMTFGITDTNGVTINGYQGSEALFYTSVADLIKLQDATGYTQSRSVTTDWAAADTVNGYALIGTALYVLLQDAAGGGTARIYKYDATDLSLGGTNMTISGISLTYNVNLIMTSNGTKLFINYGAGTTANSYDISGFTVSGTTATFVSTVTCGATTGHFSNYFAVNNLEDYFGEDTGIIYKYNNAGTLQYTSGSMGGTSGPLLNWSNTLYINDENGIYTKLYLPDTEIAPTGIQTRTVNITSAEIVTLNASPKTLIAAPGAGMAIIPLGIVYSFTAGGTQYTSGNTIRSSFSTTTGDALDTGLSSGILLSASSSITSCEQPFGPSDDIVENDSIILRNIGAEYATGNGTLKVFMNYKIIIL